MAIMPGMVVMPTVLLNTVLSFVKDSGYAVRPPDSFAVISPMYNEERGAGQALSSLLEQDSMPEQIALSINGGTDATYDVVTGVLQARGFQLVSTLALCDNTALLETWTSPHSDTIVNIALYYRRVSKSESINNLLDERIVTAERVLIVDGDTIFHPAFIRQLRHNFYRLHIRKTAKGKRYLLEDFGLQSGSVTSIVPAGSDWKQRFISAARKAEYAFSGVLRTGQARMLGTSAILGSSRLYTVIGCGFAVRKDLLPMPTDTETEDHDFTLACQSAPTSYATISVEDLSIRGFRFVVDGKELSPEELFEPGAKITYKRSGNARFVEDALMGTEDPPHFNGFIRQIERWNGGGQQNALKRIGAKLPANVHFTVWTSLIESVFGIFLLALIPLLIALNIGNPSLGLPPVALGAWFGLDVALTFILVAYGLYHQLRAEGHNRFTGVFRAIFRACNITLPFMVLRYLNPLTYVASATKVVPEFIKNRNKKKPVVRGVTWERAFVKRNTQTRTHKVFAWSMAGFAVSTIGVANIAPYLNPINTKAWELIYEEPFVDMRDYDHVPFMIVESPRPVVNIEPEVTNTQPEQPTPQSQMTVSSFCDPSFTALSTGERHLADLGDPSLYLEPNRWLLLTLARLAPILTYIETAATTYNVSVDLLLRVLLNESYLDPLAVGPTEDKGLSQVTSDALTLLKGLALDKNGDFYNPRLFPETFSVFDPDFSSCAGAAKLAWALRQPGVDNEQEAYAVYINPVYGLSNGSMPDLYLAKTEPMMNLSSMTARLASIFKLYESAPERLSEVERELVKISYDVRSRQLSVADAYAQVFEIVKSNELNDAEIYQRLLSSYYGQSQPQSLPVEQVADLR
ncbi:MAG: transglycosylase SLT domain-containing protein [Trueperaceae bacterium]|nr:transglycosylase SLT domain-containing protein [Trueperaceae bacterium]